MTLYFAITFFLSLTSVNGDFLDDCPIDRGQRIGDDLVIDVLKAFYEDLVFLGAANDSPQARNYTRLIEAIRNIFPAQMSSFLRREIVHRLGLLESGRYAQAIGGHRSIYWDLRNMFEVRSYLHYFIAEALRMLGNTLEAMRQVLDAVNARHRSRGIPVNDLEKTEGLVTLQRVSDFNRRVDWSYGLSSSPNYQVLSLVQLLSRDELIPIRVFRIAVKHRLSGTSPTIGPSGSSNETLTTEDTQRIDPNLDDFSADSVLEAQARGILCEFARKLNILGSSSSSHMAMDHSRVMNQLRMLVPDFASGFYELIVRNIEENEDQLALQSAQRFWSILQQPGSTTVNLTSADRHEAALMIEIFAMYFEVLIHLRSRERCAQLVNRIETLFTMITDARLRLRGLSLDKIVQLEGRIVFIWLKCFHKRVQLAYDLDGTDDKQQHAAKLAEFGGSDRIIPQSN